MHRFVAYLLKSINILNILLILTASIVGYMAFSPLIYTRIKVPLPKAKVVLLDGRWNVQDVQYPPLADFAKIPDQNLFHPDRIIPVEKMPIPMPELVLYGTLITDDISVAYVEDKKAPPPSTQTQSQRKRQISLKKGQSISGFVLKEIDTDRIVLYRGKEKLVVKQDGLQKTRSSDTAASASTAQPKAHTGPSPTPGASQQQGLPQKRGPGSWLLNK